MNKRNNASSIILVLLCIQVIATFLFVYLFFNSPEPSFPFFLIITGFVAIFLITIIFLYFFRRKYLSVNKIISVSNKNTNYIIFLISGIIPFWVSTAWGKPGFTGGAIFIIAGILSVSSIFRPIGNYSYRSLKEKYILALSLNLSSTGLYLAFYFIYLSFFRTERNFTDWKDLVSSLLGRIPDVISQIFLLFPLLLVFTILTFNFIKTKKILEENYDNDVLDSNIFNE